MEEFGIIILRHVSKKQHNNLWFESYRCARKIYPNNKIIIIDDNSNKSFIDDSNMNLNNCEIINSEYPGRGELLPYLYLLKYKWFKISLIIHDSVFIQKKVELSNLNTSFIPLWSFPSKHYAQDNDQKNILNKLNNNDEILKYHNSYKWNGMFGGMSIIDIGFLEKINKNHNLYNLIDVIKNRYNRMSFERVSACLFHFYNDKLKTKQALNGDIFNYLKKYKFKWGLNFEQYKKMNNIIMPFVKVWSGR